MVRLPPAPSPLALAAPRQKNDSPPFLLLGRFTLCPLPPPRLELPWLGHSDKLNITQPKLSSSRFHLPRNSVLSVGSPSGGWSMPCLLELSILSEQEVVFLKPAV